MPLPKNKIKNIETNTGKPISKGITYHRARPQNILGEEPEYIDENYVIWSRSVIKALESRVNWGAAKLSTALKDNIRLATRIRNLEIMAVPTPIGSVLRDILNSHGNLLKQHIKPEDTHGVFLSIIFRLHKKEIGFEEMTVLIYTYLNDYLSVEQTNRLFKDVLSPREISAILFKLHDRGLIAPVSTWVRKPNRYNAMLYDVKSIFYTSPAGVLFVKDLELTTNDIPLENAGNIKELNCVTRKSRGETDLSIDRRNRNPHRKQIQ